MENFKELFNAKEVGYLKEKYKDAKMNKGISLDGVEPFALPKFSDEYIKTNSIEVEKTTTKSNDFEMSKQ